MSREQIWRYHVRDQPAIDLALREFAQVGQQSRLVFVRKLVLRAERT